MRVVFDPVLWTAIVLPLIALGEWYSAQSSGHVGPALFLAGCVMAIPVAIRLALTPVWLSDLAVIVAAVFLAVLIQARIGDYTRTQLASQPGSVVLIIPALLLAVALILGSIINAIVSLAGVLPDLRQSLVPFGGVWRAWLAAAVAVVVWWML